MNYNSVVNNDPTSNPGMDVNGLILDEQNSLNSPDTHETGFTRSYYFYFWIPIYQNFTDENHKNPFLNEAGLYAINLKTQRDYAFAQANDGVGEKEVTFSLGEGSILKKFRSSLVY